MGHAEFLADYAFSGTAREDIHWAVPVLSALPFGMGFLLLFMSLIKYLAFPSRCRNPSLADVAVATLLMRMKCSQQAPWQHRLVQEACSVRSYHSRPDQCK